MTKRPEPGLYFHMPEDEYHAVHALSQSGIKDLIVSPTTFWANSTLNPNLVRRETAAMTYGSAADLRLLMGHDAFYERYAPDLRQEDYPDAIAGGADLRAECARLGLAKSGTIDEMCARILEAAPDAQLWPVIQATYYDEKAEFEILSADMIDSIEASARIVESHRDAKNALSGGYPQVSMFWDDEDTGVPMKGRIDRLNRSIVDLKTFSNPQKLPIDMAIANSTARERHAIQAVVYMDGIRQIKQLFKAGKAKVYHDGSIPNDWLDRVLAVEEHQFVMVFVEQSALPNVRVKQLGRIAHGARSVIFAHAWNQYREGVRAYLHWFEKCGDKPWIDFVPMSEFADEEFPLWALEA